MAGYCKWCDEFYWFSYKGKGKYCSRECKKEHKTWKRERNRQREAAQREQRKAELISQLQVLKPAFEQRWGQPYELDHEPAPIHRLRVEVEQIIENIRHYQKQKID